jgi:hypothetical protein
VWILEFNLSLEDSPGSFFFLSCKLKFFFLILSFSINFLRDFFYLSIIFLIFYIDEFYFLIYFFSHKIFLICTSLHNIYFYFILFNQFNMCFYFYCHLIEWKIILINKFSKHSQINILSYKIKYFSLLLSCLCFVFSFINTNFSIYLIIYLIIYV